MLDGLLGRSGFSSKCKSLIKPTRTRIEVLRRRAEAKQRFLKEDLVKLLANGLDVNAYGRTEEFIAGLNLLSCYTFIDQSCEYILKQLSMMQKLGPCPEECRETVASLMFAAARFSDLPELRDLRDVFQEKYGTGLECFVNQAFVEKLASKPPVVEKRISLLQDIAAEFSIQWDSKGFKQRMDKPSTVAEDQATKVGPLSVTDDKYKQQNGNNVFRKNDHRSKERIELPHQGPTSHDDGNLNIRRKELFMAKEDKHQKERKEHHHHINVNDMKKGEEKHHKERKDHVTAVSNDMRKDEEKHHKERKDHVTDISNDRRKEEENHHKERKDHVTASLNDMRKEEKHHKERKHHVTAISNGTRDDKQDYERSTWKANVEEPIRLKSTYSSPLPPPYVKLNIPPPYSKPHNPSNSEKIKKEAHHEFEEDDCNYQNNIPLPKPRSVRRKHSKSSSSHDDIGSSEDAARIVKRISSSKRKERKGLQILFDDEHYHSQKDEEEKMMDKLLLHYSKKPSAYDARMLRKKKSSRSNTASKSPSPHHKNEADVLVPPTRSISLPHEQSGESEPKKVYARANSFQPDNQAKHVHPKLPDYDDLAARFAALRGR